MMSAISALLRETIRAATILSAIVFAAEATHAQFQIEQINNIAKNQQTLFVSVKGSPFRLQTVNNGEPTFQLNHDAIWSDLRSEEGAKRLTQLLHENAMRVVEEHVKRNSFTPEQIEKLKMAAGVQVARDCRCIRQLESSSCKKNQDVPEPVPGMPLSLFGTLKELDRLVSESVDRKDSLFRKVMNNLY